MPSSKDLHKMTPGELGELFPIVIQEYSEKWNDLYELEKKSILNSFNSWEIVKIDHIGSTAIPGLKAKPIIDILFQISERVEMQRFEDNFNTLGYELTKQPDNPPPHMTFVKGYTPDGFQGQAYHVHIRYEGDWDEIRFRDYLIMHKEISMEYEKLKLELAEKFRYDRDAYTNSKSEFIEKINKLTRK